MHVTFPLVVSLALGALDEAAEAVDGVSLSPPVASSVSSLHFLSLAIVYGSVCDSVRVLNATFPLVVSLALGALDEAAEAVDGVLSFSPCSV